MTQPCGHKAEPGRKKCRDCRRKQHDRPSRTAPRRHGRRGKPVWMCLTRDEWVTLWASQGGACAVCLTPIKNRYAPDDPCKTIANLDHSHSLEKLLLEEGRDPVFALRKSVRGLLCYFCNRNTIHSLRDDPARAERAAHYLRLPPARLLHPARLPC